jgi:hypothetical protein
VAAPDPSKLRIITWNADSISPKKHEFFDFLLENEIDIGLINETYLKRGITFSHPEFRCYRLDREGQRTKGGVAIVVRRNLSHSLLPSFNTKILECIGVSVISTSGPIHFISVYRPGGRNSPVDIANFKSDTIKLTTSRTSFFLCGDLNARHSSWGCTRANQAGKVLFECSGNFAIFHPPTHTRIPLNRMQNPSTLDIVLSNGLHDIENMSALTELSSDHLPVYFEICSDSRRETPDHFVFNYKVADWNRYRQILDSSVNLDFSLDSIEESSQVDSMIENFTAALLDARSQSVP